MGNNAPSMPNVGDLITSIQGMYNTPEAQAAQTSLNSANTNYQQQLGEIQSLPQLLSSSLYGNLDNTNDPNIIQNTANVQHAEDVMANPSGAIRAAESIQLPQSELNKQPALLTPGAQGQAMSEQSRQAGNAVSMDNAVMGARGMGISSIIGAFSNFMAQRTQQLLAGVQAAQNTRDFLFNKAQSLGGLAMQGASLQQQENALGFEQAHNPTELTDKAYAEMGDAKNMSVHDFISRYLADPRLPGMSAALLYTLYQKNGGKGVPTQQDYNEWTDLNAGQPVQKAKANIMNLLAYPEAIGQGAQGLGQMATSAVGSMLPAAMQKVSSPILSSIGAELPEMGIMGLLGGL